MLVYSAVFQYYMRFQWSHKYPYGIFLFCGLLPWSWFLSSLAEGAGSLLAGGSLIKSITFPSEVLPIVSVLSNLVHFILGLPILFIFFIAFKVKVSWLILFLPVIMLIQLVLSLGFALMLAGLTVHFRDIQQILGNLLLLWFFLCPIIYEVRMLESLPGALKWTYFLNPMAHIIVAYQDILYFSRMPNWHALGGVAGFSLAWFLIGYWVFDRLRKTYAEGI